MELRKGIDFAFRDFSRSYGDSIEAFFDPLLFFLIKLEKLLLATPWPIILLVLGALAWLGSRSWKLVIGSVVAFMLIFCAIFVTISMLSLLSLLILLFTLERVR